MGLFGSGKKNVSAGAASGVPTDSVIQMRQKGISNDQIIQSLQQQGFTSSQIFDAMTQADIQAAAGPVPEMQYQATGGPIPQQQEQMQMPPPMPEQLPPMGPMPPPEMAPSSGMDRDAIEEIAESIIDEKWEELMKNVDKIVAWKEETESRLVKMEQKMKDLKERFEALHSGVLSKVSEYDKGIKGVSTDIKAMEEVFKKTLPTFTANIGELSRLTKQMKSGKSKTK